MFRPFLFIVFLAASPFVVRAADANNRPNVLLICVDDLRPELGCYGEAHMVTPNLDRFASTGRLFTRQYVQLPSCGPARHAMMVGHYPRFGAAWDNGAFNALKPNDDILTMPEAFRAAGYKTISMGKVSHQPDGHRFTYTGGGSGELEMPDAWDEVTGPKGKWGTAWDAFFAYADGSSRTDRRQAKQPAPFAEAADVDDTGYPDGLLAEMAVERIKAFDKDKPFFMAVGFFKPHLPFNAPKKYWDLYDPAKIPMAPRPEGDTDYSYNGGGEFKGYARPEGVMTDEDTERRARHAYFAAVSYADAQVGKVLDALKEAGLDDNTIVIVWGDHGWHLGDNHWFGKHTLYERSLRSAFIVRTPGMPQPGKPTDALVGAVDLYPTLTELCHVKGPEDLDGKSFAKALNDPAAPGKEYVRGFWRGKYTYRFDRYRVTFDPGKPGKRDPKLLAVYDHQADPNEFDNIADQHPQLLQRMLRMEAENRR